MKREKIFMDGQVSGQGWRLLANLAEKAVGQTCESATGKVWKDGGTWGFDTLEDFLADVNPARSYLFMNFKDRLVVQLFHHGVFSWSIENGNKSQILTFEREADNIIKANWQAAPVAPAKPTVIFIGHGRSGDWRDLKDHLSDKHGIRVEAYETGARTGHTIRDVLEELMDKASLAILVHTPEDELADGSFNSRPNVIHETGLFQGRLGFSRAVVLLRDGTKEFSNLSGIQQIRYGDIRQSFGDVLAWVKREQNVQQSVRSNDE